MIYLLIVILLSIILSYSKQSASRTWLLPGMTWGVGGAIWYFHCRYPRETEPRGATPVARTRHRRIIRKGAAAQMSFLASDGQRRPDREGEPGPQGLGNQPDPTASRRRAPIAERVSFIAFFIFIFAIPAYLIAVAVELNVLQPDRSAFHIDFVAFWAAAKLAVAGQAVSAFDPQTLFAAQSLPLEDAYLHELFWHYPPGFHILLMPLGYLGFSPALAIFTACAATLYYLALRSWTQRIPIGLHLAFAAPPVGFVLITGNASLLWTGILLIGLSQVFRQNALGAGVMIALLTLKPQLGLMIPVALFAAGY